MGTAIAWLIQLLNWVEGVMVQKEIGQDAASEDRVDQANRKSLSNDFDLMHWPYLAEELASLMVRAVDSQEE